MGDEDKRRNGIGYKNLRKRRNGWMHGTGFSISNPAALGSCHLMSQVPCANGFGRLLTPPPLEAAEWLFSPSAFAMYLQVISGLATDEEQHKRKSSRNRS